MVNEMIKQYVDSVVSQGLNTMVKHLSDMFEVYVRKNLSNFNLEAPTIEGESKCVYKDKDSDICLISLKPTLYSFTHNRYGIAENTDIWRNKLWYTFANELNKYAIARYKGFATQYSTYVDRLYNEVEMNDNIFFTSYLGNIEINGKSYAICRFVEDQTPLEFVWKEWFTGTMKHDLLDVDKFPTLDGTTIDNEGSMKEMVRFDWRNPFERDGKRYKDECIPTEFAANWVDTTSAAALVKLVSNIAKEFLATKGYIFVDTCYFINAAGNTIYSEITPDGMRIKKVGTGSSIDKDLWRQGKDAEVICEIWEQLYKDLNNEA